MISRLILLSLGWCFVGMAIAGALLPLLPATPFALLAAACFSKSSAQAHRRLMASKFIGPLLAEWQAHRGLSYGSKIRIGAFTGCTILSGALFQMTHPGRVLLVCAGGALAMLIIFLVPLPTRQSAR